MKKSICFLVFFLSLVSISNAQVLIDADDILRLFGDNKAIHTGKKGLYGQAKNFDIHPSSSQKGLMIEYGDSESGGFYVDGDYAVIWSPGDGNRLLRIYDEDHMNSGSTTYEKFYIDGDGDFYKASDVRRKEEIKDLKDVVKAIKKLRGVTYKYKLNDKERAKNKRAKVRYGFIAQELEKVVPDVVDTDEYGNKFVNYTGLIPLLVDAMKLQIAAAENQKELVQQAETKLKNQAQTIAQMQKAIEAMQAEIAKLKKQ